MINRWRVCNNASIHVSAAALATLIPDNSALRAKTAWAWIVPLAVLVFFAYLLRGYFLR